MKHYLSALSLVVIASLSGCGGGGSAPPLPGAQNSPSIHTNDVAIPPGAVHQFPIPPVLVSEMTLGPDGNLWYTAQTDTQNLPTDVIGRVTPAGTVTVFHTRPRKANRAASWPDPTATCGRLKRTPQNSYESPRRAS